MNTNTITSLKIAFKVLCEIMKNEEMNKDTAFIRVRSYISNKICEMLISEDDNNIYK